MQSPVKEITQRAGTGPLSPEPRIDRAEVEGAGAPDCVRAGAARMHTGASVPRTRISLVCVCVCGARGEVYGALADSVQSTGRGVMARHSPLSHAPAPVSGGRSVPERARGRACASIWRGTVGARSLDLAVGWLGVRAGSPSRVPAGQVIGVARHAEDSTNGTPDTGAIE